MESNLQLLRDLGFRITPELTEYLKILSTEQSNTLMETIKEALAKGLSQEKIFGELMRNLYVSNIKV